jgi:hypothetical protein
MAEQTAANKKPSGNNTPPPGIITSLIAEFQADLDKKAGNATGKMAVRWLDVEQRLKTDILNMATEITTPPIELKKKLTPVQETIQTFLKMGYSIEKIKATFKGGGVEEFFELPPPSTPEAKQLKDWELARFQRYTRLLAQVQQEIEQYTGQVAGPVIESLLNDSAFAGLKNTLALMDASLSLAGGDVVNTTFDRLNTEAVQNIVAIASAGQPLGDLLKNAYPVAALAITKELVYGTAIGQNPRLTAKKIIEDGLANGLNHILLVARDQQVRAVREASRQSYLKSGFITRYRRLAAKQQRTCLACLALDGVIYDIGELMALHPLDRCLLPGQAVFTGRGFIPIEDVETGDVVLSHKGYFRLVQSKLVSHYQGPMVRITTTDGRTVTCTPDHRILTAGGWVEAKDLTPADSLIF